MCFKLHKILNRQENIFILLKLFTWGNNMTEPRDPLTMLRKFCVGGGVGWGGGGGGRGQKFKHGHVT